MKIKLRKNYSAILKYTILRDFRTDHNRFNFLFNWRNMPQLLTHLSACRYTRKVKFKREKKFWLRDDVVKQHLKRLSMLHITSYYDIIQDLCESTCCTSMKVGQKLLGTNRCFLSNCLKFSLCARSGSPNYNPRAKSGPRSSSIETTFFNYEKIIYIRKICWIVSM